MKKWISYILLSALLITALPLSLASAEETGCTGKLEASGNNISVSLLFPQAVTENITSLHFKVNVSISSGKMDEPVFQFTDTIKSEVKDSQIINNDNNYIIDIILSGKKDKIIFPASGQAGIGTISLKPSGSVYKISTQFTGIDNENPSAEYVTDFGQSAQEVPLTNTEIITITGNSQGQTVSSSGYVPSATKKPDVSPSPSAAPPSTTDTPDVTASPAPSGTPGIPEDTGGFDTGEKPSMSVSARKGSCIVTFKWKVTEGADGYIIYSASGKSGNYKRIRTILKPERTSCNVKMDYASSYLFRMCAFKRQEDGSRIFGQYSKVRKLTTAPVKVKGARAKISGKRVNLSWKKVKNAKGYQIYASKKKNGGYSLVKTIKKGSVLKAVVKKNKKTNYFKTRAYVNNAYGKRVYGNFSAIIKAR